MNLAGREKGAEMCKRVRDRSRMEFLLKLLVKLSLSLSVKNTTVFNDYVFICLYPAQT